MSLGSNLGNRFEHLQNAVNAIFEEIGQILKISSVYETPAMGFEGSDFLNCVLGIQSSLTPSEILKEILRIEKGLGRNRKKTKEFTSRPIDIDILFIDDLIKDSKNLTLPHPEIPNRRFVIQPMAEVNAQFQHPVSNKNMGELLLETKDDGRMHKLSKWLRNPGNDYNISKYNYIAIEGNIGAGKTSLATQIASEFNAKLILERFKDNPFLPKFYKNQSRYAFPLEMSFLADRYQQLLEDIAQFDLFKDCIVADYDVYKSLIFARITLAEEEFNLYKKLFHLIHKELVNPDIYVYLYQDTDQLLENIKKRGRSFEKGIEKEYLQKINDGYLEFVKSQPQGRVKVIDVSGMNFVKKRKDYLSVLKEILAD